MWSFHFISTNSNSASVQRKANDNFFGSSAEEGPFFDYRSKSSLSEKMNGTGTQPGLQSINGTIQRKCSACEAEEELVQTKAENGMNGYGNSFSTDNTGGIQRKCSSCEAEENELQRKPEQAGDNPEKHLLAHELTHVAQQTGTIQKTPDPDATAAGSCPSYEPAEVSKSRTSTGWLPQDVSLHTPDKLLVADFGNNQTNVKRNTLTEPLWRTWHDTFVNDGSYRIQVIGFSDCSGGERANISVRQGRAQNLERAFVPAIPVKISFRGMAALGSNVTDNSTPENRAKNRSVVVQFKQGFFFETEALANARESNAAIQNALTEIGTSSDARERNVPDYIAQRGITLEPLTPRHDSTIITPAINFFAGVGSYGNSFSLPQHARYHIHNSNASIAIQARNMPDITNLASPLQIRERIIQAVTELANLTASGPGPLSTYDQYKAQFNAWWNVDPYSTMNTEFNAGLSSFGPRTNKARAIFEKIYAENVTVKNDYDNNTGGIKEKVDTYNIPEGFNLINSNRLQVLREVFTGRAAPVPPADYAAFRTAIETAAANLDSNDRAAVKNSNDWQRMINQYITDPANRQDIRHVIDTPPAPAVAPAPVAPVPSSGGSASARTFLNHVQITGPTSPITGNNATEPVTLTPVSDRPNPGLTFNTRFTLLPSSRVLGNHISPPSPWASASLTGVPFNPTISNNGTVTMNAHLDLLNMPSGISAPTVTDFPFTINDNRQANFLSTWFSAFEYALPGGNRDLYDPTDTVRYVSGGQQFRISARLPAGSQNPGLTISVVSRLKKGGAVVQNNTASPAPFSASQGSSETISFNVSAPAVVPVTGESFDIEVDIIDSGGAVLGTKTTSFVVLPENVYTEAQAIAEATNDNDFFRNANPTDLLPTMIAQGGIAARVAAAVKTPDADGGITLLPLTARHDSATYVTTTLGAPNPGQVGYFAGLNYTNSMTAVAGAAGFRTSAFPALGTKVIVLNRTQDVVTHTKRSTNELITLLTHEAVHAMDVRPDSTSDIERYKAEFRAYWMDGRYGPPDQPVCAVGAVSCFDATFDPNLLPPGPKSRRANHIFLSLYNDLVTYPFVKPAYDNNVLGFREQVDNYLYPDGINLMVSIRLEKLRALIEAFSGASFSTLRTTVRQHMGLDVPAPASGVLDNDEKNFIRNSRAWRDLVERKITVPADRTDLKNDLGIPIAP